jgi:hypothetical protein
MTMAVAKAKNKAWFGICESFKSVDERWTILDSVVQHVLGKTEFDALQQVEQQQHMFGCCCLVLLCFVGIAIVV